MRCARDECDNSKTETDHEDCNTTRILTCSPSVPSRCAHCWVSCCASCRQWCSCRCDRPLILYPKLLHIPHRENGSFEVLSLHKEWYSPRRLKNVSFRRNVTRNRAAIKAIKVVNEMGRDIHSFCARRRTAGCPTCPRML